MRREFCLECPHCRYVMDSAKAMPSNQREAHPKAGDLSLCGRCGTLLKFTVSMDLARATEGDLDDLSPAKLSELRLAQLLISMKTEMKKGRS